jgi:hypothetical protein
VRLERAAGAPSPLTAARQRIATITDEGVFIVLIDPALLLGTRPVMARMEPDFQDLDHLGRAWVSASELAMVLELLRTYESRGSEDMRRVLQPVREQLENPRARRSLGVIVEGPFRGLS